MPLTDSLRDDILASVPSLRAFAISLSVPIKPPQTGALSRLSHLDSLRVIVNCCGREIEREVRLGRISHHSVQEFDARHDVGEELEAVEFAPGLLGLAA